MYLNSQIDALISALNNEQALEKVKFIKAYPFVNKPTRFENVVVTVSPSGIDAENISIGQECAFGSYMIDFDVFSPQELGSPVVGKTIELIISALKNFNPSAVKAEPVSVNTTVKCYTAKCTLTFSGEIDFGGDDYGA